MTGGGGACVCLFTQSVGAEISKQTSVYVYSVVDGVPLRGRHLSVSSF